jgi:hypothetical protein
MGHVHVEPAKPVPEFVDRPEQLVCPLGISVALDTGTRVFDRLNV